jgi:hypothetical protein
MHGPTLYCSCCCPHTHPEVTVDMWSPRNDRPKCCPPHLLPHHPTAPARGPTVPHPQTIIRCLKYWEARDPALNPFIEQGGASGGPRGGADPAPAALILPTDTVVAGTVPGPDGPMPPHFPRCMQLVLRLAPRSLQALAGGHASHKHRATGFILCAVRAPTAVTLHMSP